MQDDEKKEMIRLISYEPPKQANIHTTWFNLTDRQEYEFCMGGWLFNEKFIPHPKNFRELPHEEERKED